VVEKLCISTIVKSPYKASFSASVTHVLKLDKFPSRTNANKAELTKVHKLRAENDAAASKCCTGNGQQCNIYLCTDAVVFELLE